MLNNLNPTSQSYWAESVRWSGSFIETEQRRHPMDPHVYYSWLFLLIIAYAHSSWYLTVTPNHTHVLCLRAPPTLPVGTALHIRKHWDSWQTVIRFSAFHCILEFSHFIAYYKVHPYQKKGLSFQFAMWCSFGCDWILGLSYTMAYYHLS